MSPRHCLLLLIGLIAVPSCTKAETVSKPASATTIAVGERPRAITVVDFDGNGSPDIAVANADSNTVSILLRGADGSFARTDFPAGNEPADIAHADFNRDGKPDIAIANHETSSVTILLNTGDGMFEPMAGSPFDTAATPHLHSVAVADFNDDGFMDIASDSSDSDSIAVLFGREGGFQAAQQVGVGEFPYYRLGTLPTSDGTRVLVPSPRAHQVSKVDPSTADGVTNVGQATGAVMARSANFDGDNKTDVAAIVSAGIMMWNQSKNGFDKISGTPVSFENATELAVGDINGDTMDEVITSVWESNEIYIISSEGERLKAIKACFRPAALALADLNGDGRSEIIAGCWNEPEIMIFDGATVM